jgi:hypothetical protein
MTPLSQFGSPAAIFDDEILVVITLFWHESVRIKDLTV